MDFILFFAWRVWETKYRCRNPLMWYNCGNKMRLIFWIVWCSIVSLKCVFIVKFGICSKKFFLNRGDVFSFYFLGHRSFKKKNSDKSVYEQIKCSSRRQFKESRPYWQHIRIIVRCSKYGLYGFALSKIWRSGENRCPLWRSFRFDSLTGFSNRGVVISTKIRVSSMECKLSISIIQRNNSLRLFF